ncbi:MAG: PP2C family protein-serine/threonine phosphatase [Pseudomonadota bacterium]
MTDLRNMILQDWASPAVAVFCLAQIGLVGLIDFLTGPDLSFSIFYLAPVLTAAWFSNRTVAIAVSVGSAIVWLVLDVGTSHPYPNPVIPFWNAGVRLGFFLITGYLAANLKLHLKIEKEKADAELKIAHDIQMSLLPGRSPSFPGQETIQVSARLEPARMVGGDFYDFFFLDADHFFFCIGDVSGKGISAALLMAKTMNLIKLCPKETQLPSDIMDAVNTEICAGNDVFFFITVFCGVLNTRTGEITYTNAGHNPPLHLRKNRSATYLPLARTTALGIDAASVYVSERLRLAPGDILFMYTDGITDTFGSGQQVSGEDGLKEALLHSGGRDLDGVVTSVFNQAKSDPGPDAQHDDITLLAIAYGPEL